MAIARKIAYNVVVSSISKVLSTIIALISIGFITRYLGKEGFGNYATVLAFLSFLAALSDLGLYQISTREISRTGADEKKIMGNIFSLRVISSLVIILITPIIISFFNYPEEVNKGIIIVAISFLFSSSYQILNGVFQKNLAMDKVALGELLGKLIQMGVIILTVKFDLGFSWIMTSLLCYMVFTFCVIFLLSRKYIVFKLQFDFSYWKKFLKEAAPLGISAIITFFYFKMDTILLSLLRGSLEVGIYNAAYKVLENIIFFPAMIVGLVLPLLAKNIFENRSQFENISNKTIKVFIILTVPLLVGMFFLAESVIQVIGGSDFFESVQVLRILSFALVLIFFGHFFNVILIVGNLQKKLMYVLGVVAILNITANFLLIPRFSYLASAYVSVGTEFLVVALTFFLVSRNIKYQPRIEKGWGIIAAGFLMAIFLYLFRNYEGLGQFVLLVISSSVIYFFFLWVFKAVKTSEITGLISKQGVQNYEELS